MSLKQTIKYYLEKHGSMNLQELDSLCKQEQKKLSNGERRLRELMHTDPITPILNSAKAIIGYKWSISSKTPLDSETCPHCKVWLNHSINCPTKAQKEVNNQLF